MPESFTIAPDSPRTSGPYHVLFLCVANSARSIIAESILNKIGGGRYRLLNGRLSDFVNLTMARLSRMALHQNVQDMAR